MADEIKRGTCNRFFRMTCGVCGKSEDMQYENGSGNYEASIEKFCARAWRVTEQWGYVHKSCIQLSPSTLKFE